MKLTTKFSLGDRVITIASKQIRVHEPCTFCEGAGRITGADDQSAHCPACFGKGGINKWLPEEWRVNDGTGTIGMVCIRVTDSPGRDGEEIFTNFKAQTDSEERYMLVETGVGSGTMWRDDCLFPTVAEAEAACAERNAVQASA